MNKKSKKEIHLDDDLFFGSISNSTTTPQTSQKLSINEFLQMDDEDMYFNKNDDDKSVEEVYEDEDNDDDYKEENKIQYNEDIKKIDIDVKMNPWIMNVNEEDRNRVCNEYLKIGYMISNMTKTTMDASIIMKPIQEGIEKRLGEMEHRNELQMTVMNTRVSENLERVKTSIDKFTEFSNKSAFKGAMGENLVESVIQHYFPDDTIINTSKKTAESDYHLRCHNGTTFLIESKFYTSIVNKQEIDKFRRDLLKMGFPIGIFISLSSGIVGKKRFDVERLNEHQIILYVPNAGFDGGSIVWSILFGKEILKYILDFKIDKDINDFHEIYDSFQDIYQYFSSLKLQIMEQEML